MNGYFRASTVLVAIAVALLASACTSGAPPTAASGAPPQAMPSGTQDLKAGTYAFAFPQLDAPGKPFPKALITVPDGWSINDGFALLGHAGSPAQLAVTIWDVVDVYANGCHWAGPMIHPGATVDELAAVLAARPLRNATAPVAVSLGGYQGKYLQWSVPPLMRTSRTAMAAGSRAGMTPTVTAISKVRGRSTGCGSSPSRATACWSTRLTCRRQPSRTARSWLRS